MLITSSNFVAPCTGRSVRGRGAILALTATTCRHKLRGNPSGFEPSALTHHAGVSQFGIDALDSDAARSRIRDQNWRSNQMVKKTKKSKIEKKAIKKAVKKAVKKEEKKMDKDKEVDSPLNPPFST
jgi:hypothetical protein